MGRATDTVIYATPPRDSCGTTARAIPTVVDRVGQGVGIALGSARIGALNAYVFV